MQQTTVFKEATPAAKLKGWQEIAIVHTITKRSEYKEFFYVSRHNGLYSEHKYKTIWIKYS